MEADLAIERVLEAAWRQVLEDIEFGPDDNFFELGGTSFDAVLVIEALNAELGTDISEIGLFERPTIRAMSALLRPAAAGPDEVIVASQRRGARRRASTRVRLEPGPDA